jgi:hypothetical protein
MAGYRFWLQSSLSVVLALTIVQAGRSQTNVQSSVFENGVLQVSKPVGTTGSICKVYSLRDLGDDPNLCKWIAETIPDVIQPESWKQHGVKLSYHAPSKILVVNHTSAVHAEVDEFLQNLKKSLPQQKVTANRPKHDPAAAPAVFYPPIEKVPAGLVQAGPSSYPVPFPPHAPKHLFHFIIRYEGEGIIDSSVVKFAKALSNASLITTTNEAGPPMVCPTPVPTPQYLSQPAQYGYPPASTSSQRGSTWGNAPVMPPADPAPTPRNPSAPPPQTSGYSELLPPPTPLPPATPLPPNRAAPAEKSVLPYTPPPPPPPVTIP